jgi:hypothetical protein
VQFNNYSHAGEYYTPKSSNGCILRFTVPGIPSLLILNRVGVSALFRLNIQGIWKRAGQNSYKLSKLRVMRRTVPPFNFVAIQ